VYLLIVTDYLLVQFGRVYISSIGIS